MDLKPLGLTSSVPASRPPVPPQDIEPTLETSNSGDACADAIHQRVGELWLGGMTAALDAVKHVYTNIQRGKEALLTFNECPGRSFSVRSVDDLNFLTQAVRWPQQLNPSEQALLGGLDQLGSRGGDFFFRRRSGPTRVWLRTDSRGAALLLRRGESVHHRDIQGKVTRLASARDAVAEADRPAVPGDASLQKAAEKLHEVERAGFDVLSSVPKASPLDPLRNLLASRGILEDRREAVERLAQGQEVYLYAPGAYAAPQAATLRQLTQLGDALNGRASEAQQQALNALAELRQADNVLLSRVPVGEGKDRLTPTEPMQAYLNLLEGGETMLLRADGSLSAIPTLESLAAVKSGPPKEPAAPSRMDGGPVNLAQKLKDEDGIETWEAFHDRMSEDASFQAKYLDLSRADWPSRTWPVILPRVDGPLGTPSENLVAIYAVQPFDPTRQSVYEDFPTRAKAAVSPHLHVLTLQTDRPDKRAVRLEYDAPGTSSTLATFSEGTSLGKPESLRGFVSYALSARPDDKHVRLIVSSHGGAEHGPVVDGWDLMSPDRFAEAIHDGVTATETGGARRKIDNLICPGCLMGNTAFIYALARKGDVETLCASPEVTLGSTPVNFLSQLADKTTADCGAEAFAAHVVDRMTDLSSASGTGMHALVYGAYRLDAERAETMKAALHRFLELAVKHEDCARWLKEDVASIPSFGSDDTQKYEERDLIGVAERIGTDARLPRELREAASVLAEATRSLVIKQAGEGVWGKSKGPTLALPLNSKGTSHPTSLLAGSRYDAFLKLLAKTPIASDPLQAWRGSPTALPSSPFGQELPALGSHTMTQGRTPALLPHTEEEADAVRQTLRPHDDLLSTQHRTRGVLWRPEPRVLEQATPLRGLRRAARVLAEVSAGTVLTAGALLTLGPAGAVLGLYAGATGRSLEGIREKYRLSNPGPALLLGGGLAAHRTLTHRFGLPAGRVLSAGIGSISGAIGGTVAALLAGPRLLLCK